MRIDYFDFEHTAKAVYAMNPTSRTMYSSWVELREFMVSIAYRYAFESNSFSTGGFVLTAYDGHDGERVVRASVSGWLATKYLEDQLETA